MASWLLHQRADLKQGLSSIRDKKKLVVTQPFFRIDEPVSDLEIFFANDHTYRADENFRSDIFFNQGYGPDRERLSFVRKSGRTLIHATWFWDNHHMIADTIYGALLSDIYFYAHNYSSSYIRNRFSIDGGFNALCPIFWQLNEVEEAATRAILAPRSDQLYGGYNSYAEFPDRDVLIEQIKSRVPNNNLFITPHGTPLEAHPFYSMTPVDRMLEWMHYKVSLCLSFGNNTAIRIFDMLLGGGIPLIIGRPADLDLIIPRHDQEMLPIVVVDDASPDVVAEAYAYCLRRFEEGGLDGVMTRHAYIKHNHMPHHRLGRMVDIIRKLAEDVDRLDDMLDG